MDNTEVKWMQTIELRDYFAAKAMLGMWSNDKFMEALPSGTEAQSVAAMSYEMADAMLKARES